MQEVQREQVLSDIQFVQYLAGHVTDMLCDEDVFKAVRVGFYPEDKVQKIEYFLKNTFLLVYTIAIDKENAEAFVEKLLLKSFPKDVREGKIKPEYKDYHIKAKKRMMELYTFVKDEVESAREEGRISF